MSKVQKALKRIRDSRARSGGSGESKRPQQRVVNDAPPAYEPAEPPVAATPAAEPAAPAPAPAQPTQVVSLDETSSLPRVVVPEQVVSVEREALLDAGLLTGSEPDPAVAASYRRIKRPLITNAFSRGAMVGDCANVIMLTSAMPGAGKSFCSYGLAVSIAQERDIGAVLIDADVLKPTITHAFGLERNTGITDFLTDESIAVDDLLVRTDIDDIVVIPAGAVREDSTELLASRRMRRLIQALSVAFSDRLVILDTPPMLLTTEAQVLADHVGQVVLVIEAGVTGHGDVLEVLEGLDKDKPVNAILNKSRNVAAGPYGGNYYGYAPAKRSGGDDENDNDEQT
ncbi:MAG: protein tyrosine kinase [Pseudomonadota bacterium]